MRFDARTRVASRGECVYLSESYVYGGHDGDAGPQERVPRPGHAQAARAILGRRSESEAIREALELVAFRTKVMKGYDG